MIRVLIIDHVIKNKKRSGTMKEKKNKKKKFFRFASFRHYSFKSSNNFQFFFNVSFMATLTCTNINE